MTICPALTLDFGDVGYAYDKKPFRVVLDARSLDKLIADARSAYRVYELALIQRPGDLFDYVRVVPEALPQEVAGRVERVRADAARRDGNDLSDGSLLFDRFDAFFELIGDDTDPASAAWLGRHSRALRDDYVDRLLVIVRGVLAELDDSDPLLRHELLLARENRHRRSHRSRADACWFDPHHRPNPLRHSEGYYRHLAQLLADPALASVAYRGKGDWRMLRMLCTEQRQRAELSGQDPGSALKLSALTDYRGGVLDWGGQVRFHGDGLAHGDLFIEAVEGPGNSIKDLIEKYGRSPRVVLADDTPFEIAGYQRECGDGWVVYQRSQTQSTENPGETR